MLRVCRPRHLYFRSKVHDWPPQTSRRQNFSSFNALRQDDRPPTAPKQFPNIKQIRKHVELYRQNCLDRNYAAQARYAERVAEIAGAAASTREKVREPNGLRKKLQEEIAVQKGAASPDPDKIEALLAEVLAVSRRIADLETGGARDEEAHRLALSLPNLTSPQSPQKDPRLISYINYDPVEGRQWAGSADHRTIGTKLSLLDFSSASTTTGGGFYYLQNEAALLEQALVQYALAVAMRHGWRAVSPPTLVYSHIAEACGFQPRDHNDEQQIWQIQQQSREQGKPQRSLTATAEIPLAGLHASKAIPAEELPIKLVGSSRCYRAEAGARGVATKGLYRVHEFTKVEMFAWTMAPDAATTDPTDPEWTRHATLVFDETVAIQTEILSSLGLPCRVLEMPGTDLGASAYRKIDIETIFPSRVTRDEGWGEVSSASICTDYQSRRLDTRVLTAHGKKNVFAHTVNGTAMAIPRVLAAILEHGWKEDEGVVVVPEVLRPYMAGLVKIGSQK